MCNSRIDQMNDFSIFPPTVEYEMLINKTSKLLKELIDLVPPDNKRIAFEIEEAYTAELIYDQDRFYRQGLKDGKEILSLY